MLAFLKVINKLKANHFPTFLVGGAVRDLVLGLEPTDFDLATSAKPEDIEQLFPNTKPIGREFGVMLIIEDGQAFEVATFRRDIGYSDNRRPDQVIWSGIKEDAFRRDFTINALFLDPDPKADFRKKLEIISLEQLEDLTVAQTNLGRIIDYVGGLADLEKRRLKFVGKAADRIAEDYLRIIRAIRFKAQFNLRFGEEEFQELVKNVDKIKEVSAERISWELDRLLVSARRAEAICELDKIGALTVILPELAALKTVEQSKKFYQTGNIFDHALLALSNLPEEVEADIAWATLLHDIGKPATLSMGYDRKKRWTEKFHNHNVVGAQIAEQILKRLKLPKQRIERILWLIDNHQMPPQILTMRPGRQKRWLLDPRLPDLLALHRADAMGKEKRVYLGWYNQVKKMMEDELHKPPPPPKLIDGHDIMNQFNLPPGPEIGRLLSLVDEAQWEGQIKTKEEAIELVRKNIKHSKN